MKLNNQQLSNLNVHLLQFLTPGGGFSLFKPGFMRYWLMFENKKLPAINRELYFKPVLSDLQIIQQPESEEPKRRICRFSGDGIQQHHQPEQTGCGLYPCLR